MIKSEDKRDEQGVETRLASDHTADGDGNMAKPQSTKFAAFQFYPRDFLTSSKVARMSLIEIGIYITLLCYSWLDSGLPSDVGQLAKLMRMPLPRFRKLWAGVLSECFVPKGTKLVNPRQERQRKELHDYVAGCQRGGERSAEARRARLGSAQPPKPPRSDLEVTPNTSSSSSSSSSSSEKNVRTAPLVARRRKDAAFEGPRVYVPQRAHSDFVALRNGAEAELFAWYEQISEAWTMGVHQHDEPGADMFAFWKARYAERWPVAKVDKRLPEWAR